MFFKVGFFVLLVVVIALIALFMRINPMKSEGAGSWTEYYSADPAATIKFLGDTFGIEVTENSKAVADMDYSVLKAKGQLWPFAGIMGLPALPDGGTVPPSTMVYLTVKDYDASHAKMMENGAVTLAESQLAGNMKFGIYTIPGGITIGVAQYGVK